MALLRDTDMEISSRGDEVELPRALLRDDFLDALRSAVRVEVLHLNVATLGHLGLVLPDAADLDGAHRNPEVPAAATNGLDELHESVAKNPGADLLLQRILKFVLFHGLTRGGASAASPEDRSPLA